MFKYLVAVALICVYVNQVESFSVGSCVPSPVISNFDTVKVKIHLC